MRKLLFTCITAGVSALSAHSQTLFTYGSRSVSKDDFLRVYKKNSINKKPDMSEKELRGYLDLYALFRMKVAEADKQQLDTVQSIGRELDNYRRQLAKNYLTDEQVTNKLIREAYDRMKENVHAAHIVISCPLGTDTVRPYKLIDSIYHVIESKKQTFEQMAKEFSDDKATKDNGGDVGYLSSLQSVYPFENAIYSTGVGMVSRPFKTQFGYHIVKVIEKHADKGQVKVAQILIQTSKAGGEASINAARKRADSIEVMLKGGADFTELVKKYSDDKFSVADDGVMKTFGTGKYVHGFEDAAFALKKPGDVSAPVQTEYGFHIIKLLAKYPLAPFDSMQPMIKRKVENDSRSQVAKDIFFARIKEKNGFKEYSANLEEVFNKLMAIPDTGKDAKMIIANNYSAMNKPVFSLAGKNYTQNDFVKFFEGLSHGRINGPKSGVIHDGYSIYVDNVVNDFEEHKLVEENIEFKHLMEEYRDGIMLFELMDRNVWSKAAHDTIGLKAFYESHKNKYMWEPGFEGSVYKFKNRAAMDTTMDLVAKKFTDDSIVRILNTPANPDRVSIQRGRYEFSRFKDATQAELTQNKRKIIPTGNGTYTVVLARELFAVPTQKSLDEARGYVVAEYQDFLEKQWNEKMKSQYPLKVNETVFKSMVKK